ncbi:S4 domain-containing protein YaaA [uncultured Vagococcus sp.]|uniref:S4 domain-containing protein YaaA n=1 Tax=uncultured Vagococcus sp. TaxID=189676 RepID=UPI0028D09BC2|nr:S4 domain-containing protein YaaA [uncultured Vagococcus sp.]
MKETFKLNAEFIRLGQFLKEIQVISSGGMAKWYLSEHVVFVDGEVENRRGRKLYPGMMIEIPDTGTFFMEKMTETTGENPHETD